MQRDSLLIDIGALSDCCSGHALESLAKAMSGEEETGPDIWALHESPFIQSLIELFSSRGLLRIQKVQDELNAWLAGKHYKPHVGVPPATPNTPMLRWLPDELSLVRLYLESLPPAEFALSDWSLVIDYLAHRYMPAGEMASEAEWLAVRSTMMGKVQAAMGAATVAQADALLGALPLTVYAAQQAFNFGENDKINHILNYGRLRCADQVVQLTESVRHRLKRVILAHQEQVLTGMTPPKESLQTQLFDEFAALNRDWRRISVTESGENANQGLIASLAPGSRVRRMEQYRGACPYCKKINGVVLTVVDPAAKKKDGVTQVWVGKTNLGRSGAPRKRVGAELIEREPHERWWLPAGTVHPHCRGSWHVMEGAKPGDDPSFQVWLDKHLHKIQTP